MSTMIRDKKFFSHYNDLCRYLGTCITEVGIWYFKSNSINSLETTKRCYST